jgi:hypothetical protein
MNRKIALAAVTALALIALTGCGQDNGGGAAPATNNTPQSPTATPIPGPADTPTPGSGDTPIAAPSTPSVTPSAPPKPPKPTKPVPTAADGTNYQACADARCEVSVRTGTRIPVKQSVLGFKTLVITRVSGGSVDFGGKSSCCSVSGGDQQPGNTFRLNNLKITTIAVTPKTAILRLSPA